MASTPANRRKGNHHVPGGPRSTQRERLLNAMCVIAADEGYAPASVARVIAYAGVSRRTFYEHFADKQDCFVALLALIHQRLAADVRGAVRRERPECALHAAMAALVGFATAGEGGGKGGSSRRSHGC
jgi:AcrR family transcriptional regulator